MTEETLQKDGRRLSRALPMYVAVQVATLLFTALDSPVYREAYHVGDHFRVNGWVGAWFALVLFGLANTIFLMVRRSWRILFDDGARPKLALCYFLGSLAGLLTLGIRFLPLVAPLYFVLIGGLALLSIGVYLVWSKRVQQPDELFP